MLKQASVLQFDRFRGMNQALPAPKIPDGDFVNLQNWRVFLGDLVTRLGSVQHASLGAGSTIFQMHDYRRTEANSVRRFFIHHRGSSLFKLVNGVETTVKTLLPSARGVSMVTFNRLLIVSDGENLPFSYDGDGVNVISTGPRAKFLRVHNNHVFAAGIRDNPNNLQVSNLSNGTVWDLIDLYQLDAGDGDQITGMGNPGGALSIYQFDSIWVLAGTARTNFSIYNVATGKGGKGSVSHEGIVTVDKVDFYIGKRNAYAFDGSTPVAIGDAIARKFIQAMNPGRWSFIKGRYFPKYDEIWWSLTSGTANQNDTILVFNRGAGGWYFFKGILAESMALIEDDNGQPAMFTGGYDGKILRQDTGYSDNGSAIVNVIESKAHALENLALFKRHRNLVLYCHALKSVVPTLEYWFDQDETTKRTKTPTLGTPTSTWDTALWDVGTWDGVDLVRTIVPLVGVGRQAHWRLTMSGTSHPIAIQSYAIEGRVRGLR